MDRADFLEQAGRYQRDGWRLAIINATSLLPAEGLEHGAFDISWSFAKGRRFEHIVERVMPGEQVPSISTLFGGAFLYENEIRELFGVNVTGIAPDLHGQLYKTAERVPFSPGAIRARLEASGRAEPAKHVAGPKPDALPAGVPTARPQPPGPTSSGPTAVGPTAVGSTASGPTAVGPTAIGPTAAGPTSSPPPGSASQVDATGNRA